jgi:hypothetical protein
MKNSIENYFNRPLGNNDINTSFFAFRLFFSLKRKHGFNFLSKSQKVRRMKSSTKITFKIEYAVGNLKGISVPCLYIWIRNDSGPKSSDFWISGLKHLIIRRKMYLNQT